jgi:methylated-DNA-[protein]-cysteine S-methyltransferase
MAPDLTWTRVATPLGPLTVVTSSAGVVATELGDPSGRRSVLEVAGDRSDVRRDDDGLAALRHDVEAYFAGRTHAFATPVDLSFARGFTRRVYEATIAVPYGELRTYGDIASAAGSARAYRAAGTALRHCPIELWIPCHRVVPAGPGFGTYGGHPERREFLLRLERAI